jgi:hypothetical protein
MSKIEVNTIEPQCGTTLTLGASGDTVTLASGASQSGFGRTGTVDWQTGSIKTTTFTAVNGQGFFVDTNGGAVIANLPAGSAGAIVSFQDYRNTFDTAGLTISPNGSEKINGGTGDINLLTEGEGVTLVYIDSTIGWRSIQDNVFADVGSNFINATGGTESISGNCKIHTFTGPGTFTVNSISPCAANNQVSHLVVAGGGGGGYCAGGGGGAGGFRENKSPVTPYTASPLDGQPSAPNRVTVTATAFPITVGGGGTGQSGPGSQSPGNNSIFSTITSHGGGAGGGNAADASQAPAGGAGNTPPVSPAQGFPGGAKLPANPPFNDGGMGGGGATAAGENMQNPFTPSTNAPDGGAGATTSITASPVAYSGGGGGGAYVNCGPATGGSGGTGGGGAGATPSASGAAGTTNRGGGGGGGGNGSGPLSPGGNGGSGIVVIRYKFQ